jgi:hypothetical protein
MTNTNSRAAPIHANGLLPASLSLVACALAPIATLAITLRDGYMRLRGEEEYFFVVLLLGPYLLLALLAWWRRRSRRESVALLILTALLVAFGLWALAGESAEYRAALAESPRGPDYMRDRYQRMGLFLVPALQWIACLIIGTTLCISAWWRRVSSGARLETLNPEP